IASPATSQAQFVPTSQPSSCSPPETARRIGFLKALAFYWIAPARLGPHLAAGGFLRAVAAHALALALAFAVIGGALAVRAKSDVRTIEDVRAVLAEYVLELAAQSSTGGWTGAIAYWILLIIPIIEVALLAIAALAVPFVVAGDNPRSVWRR